jgi:hypothetical protein
MRIGMSRTIRAAGAVSSAPPAPGLVQNAEGVWGQYVAAADAPQGLANSSAETVFVPYQATIPKPTTLRTGGECPPGTAWGPDPTGREEFACVPVSTTGDTSPGRSTGTGDQNSPLAGLGSRNGTRLPSLLPVLRQLIPCTPSWQPRAYGGPNLAPPTLGPVVPAGAAGFTTELTVADVAGWVAFGLGALVGKQLIDNVYEKRRTA